MATEDTSTSRKHRRTSKTIRNLTNKLVHLRLRNDQNDAPYRIEMQARGRRGDWHTVPASLTDSDGFVGDLGSLFEVIPLSEAKAIQYEPLVSHAEPVPVTRVEDTTISRSENWDGQGRAPLTRPSGAPPERASVLGSDPGGEGAMPAQVPTTVTTERVKG